MSAGLTPDSGERYARESLIATGGMGEVWRARDTVLGRAVAVKVLKAEYAHDATFRARFAAEARHAAALHHPGIASVFDYGVLEEGDAPYLVMELVDGKPLSDLLVGGRPFDPDQARALIVQAADALGAAHEAGVVHRDVKPGNLMVTPDGRVKITDFGIARAADSVPITQTGQIIGTPHYLSPEQARGNPATSASDVYALGVVLFECLAGHRPFSADTPVATALAHLNQDVPELPTPVPADLAAVVRRALAKDPAERYADGAALAEALRSPDAAAVPPPVPADGTQVLAPVDAPVAATQVVRRTTTSPSRVATAARDRSRWPLYAAGLLALLLFVVLLIARPWDTSSTSTKPPTKPSPSAKTQTSASTTPSSSPSASNTPKQVQVDKASYVGQPAPDVQQSLKQLGLKTTTQTKDNPGDQAEGTVADLSPSGQVDQGSTIALQVWGPVAKPDGKPGKGHGHGNGQGNG